MQIIEKLKSWWKEVKETEPLVWVHFEVQGDNTAKRILVPGYRDLYGNLLLTVQALELIDKTKAEIMVSEESEAIKIAKDLGCLRQNAGY